MILSLCVRNEALLEEILARGRKEARAKEGQVGFGWKQEGRDGLGNSVKCLRGVLASAKRPSSLNTTRWDIQTYKGGLGRV